MTTQESATLPGYVGLIGGSTLQHKSGVVTAERKTGDFLVRGRRSVHGVKDGWVVKTEDGYLCGIEDVDFVSLFNVPPAAWTDVMMHPDIGAKVGVPYSSTVEAPDNSPATVVSASIAFGTIHPYPGLTLSVADPAAITLIGTPDPIALGVSYGYFEITFGWSDGKSARQRYAFAVLPP